MSKEDRDAQFKKIADAFITLANEKVDTAPAENVSMALLYAAARFNSFVVASHADDIKKYEADRETAFNFFLSEYKKMLNENLDDYRRVYDESLKYEHLIPNKPN